MNEHVRFPVEDMTCGACVSRITRAVRKLEGVEAVRVDLGDETATVRFDQARTNLAAIGAAVAQAGYRARLAEAQPFTPEPRRGLLARLGLRY